MRARRVEDGVGLVHGGIEGLAKAVQQLSLARRTEDVHEVVRTAARGLTGCDGATLALREGEACFFAGENAIAPLWKGRRVPMTSSVSGWAMLHGEAAVVPDVQTDPRIVQDQFRSTFVSSLVVVPIGTLDPVGAIGNYWAQRHVPTSVEVSLLQALADATAVALENVTMRAQIERTAAVTEANRQLEQEIEEHWRFAAEVYRQSVTDELTGLYNRRGFFKRAEQELAALREARKPGLVLFLDVDGLKDLNDREGHDAGDRLLVQTADVLGTLFRDQDVIGRLGGDEFAVFVPGSDDVDRMVERLRSGDARVRLSIGSATFDPSAPRGLYELLGTADSHMYDDKRARRAG